MSSRAVGKDPVVAAIADRSRPSQILLVDHSEIVLLFERTMLEGAGFQVRSARSGAEALAEVEKTRPDLVLLDILMPGLDGIEVCRRIKENPSTSDIPIVMVSARSEQDVVERAFRAGCNDYLTKPIDGAELLAKVRSCLGQDRSEGRAAP